MSHRNLQEFLSVLKQAGELQEIEAEVDPVLEVTEIYDRIVKKEGPALLFKHVKGSQIPLLINLFGSKKRMNLLFEASDVQEIADRIESFLVKKI